MIEILSLLEPLLVGCLPEAPPRNVRQAYGAVWQPEHVVPGMLGVWPHLERYAREQRFTVDIPIVGRVSGWLAGDPVPEPRGLLIKIAYKLGEAAQEERLSRMVEWPDEFSRRLLMGEPVQAQQYQFQLERQLRLPTLVAHKGQVRVRFPTIHIRRRGLLGWLLQARIGGLVANASGASVELFGLRGKLVSPKLVWS